MNLREMTSILEENPLRKVEFVINSERVPGHFHITEVGRVSKIFIDCGGKRRDSLKCVLQVWVADDINHKIDASKMMKILQFSDNIFEKWENPEVQVEYEKGVVSQYPVNGFDISKDEIRFHLGFTHTACLAPEKCGGGCSPTNIVDLRRGDGR
jgi:hypothetical protein